MSSPAQKAAVAAARASRVDPAEAAKAAKAAEPEPQWNSKQEAKAYEEGPTGNSREEYRASQRGGEPKKSRKFEEREPTSESVGLFAPPPRKESAPPPRVSARPRVLVETSEEESDGPRVKGPADVEARIRLAGDSTERIAMLAARESEGILPRRVSISEIAGRVNPVNMHQYAEREEAAARIQATYRGKATRDASPRGGLVEKEDPRGGGGERGG